MQRTALPTIVVIALAAAQIWFGWSVRNIDPKRDYLPVPPPPAAQSALAFGDSQFLYRIFALDVQNAGDTGGRIVPVKNYNFDRVVDWLDVLAQLDPRSDFALGMANGYFGQSQNVENVTPIVHFMMRDVAVNPPQRWRWLFGAIYLARHRLRDDGLALEAAQQLSSYDFEGLDPWATLAPAFILEDQGKYKDAEQIAQTTAARFGSRLSNDDASWIANYMTFLLEVEAGKRPPRKRTW